MISCGKFNKIFKFNLEGTNDQTSKIKRMILYQIQSIF